MSSESTFERICEVSVMRELPQELRERVAYIIEDISKKRKVPKGAVILREMEGGNAKGYILLEGAVGVLKTDAPKHRVPAPELLGEIMQFTPAQVRTATVGAVEDCLVLKFEWDTFWAALTAESTPDEVGKVRSLLEERAWTHFAE